MNISGGSSPDGGREVIRSKIGAVGSTVIFGAHSVPALPPNFSIASLNESPSTCWINPIASVENPQLKQCTKPFSGETHMDGLWSLCAIHSPTYSCPRFFSGVEWPTTETRSIDDL